MKNEKYDVEVEKGKKRSRGSDKTKNKVSRSKHEEQEMLKSSLQRCSELILSDLIDRLFPTQITRIDKEHFQSHLSVKSLLPRV